MFVTNVTQYCGQIFADQPFANTPSLWCWSGAKWKEKNAGKNPKSKSKLFPV
jgi:hypothetical protein